jgi:hypothetical protein
MIENGIASELPAMLGPHPLEDIMHLASWIQLYTILHAGTKPSEFECFPDYNGRPPELVFGRTYPLLSCNSAHVGTICVGPDGRTDAAKLTSNTDPAQQAWTTPPLFDVRRWFKTIRDQGFMVAPLVFRHYAVFKDSLHPGTAPLVAVDFRTQLPGPCDVSRFPVDTGNPVPAERQFLSTHGNYMLAKSLAEIHTTPFVDAHANLLPIGTFMLVDSRAIQQFGIGGPKQWVRGSLRYPDEALDGDESDEAQIRVYVTIKIRTRPGEDLQVRVVYAIPTDCRVFSEMRVTEADYSIDATHHFIRIQGGGVEAAQAPQ